MKSAAKMSPFPPEDRQSTEYLQKIAEAFDVRYSPQCPPGMELILSASTILVQRNDKCLDTFCAKTSNRYEILDLPSGKHLYTASEDIDCITSCCFGSRRPFVIDLTSFKEEPCLRFVREHRCSCIFGCLCYGRCCDSVQIFNRQDAYAGRVVQRTGWFRPKYSLYDEREREVLSIIGPYSLLCVAVFKIENQAGQEVGQIRKGFQRNTFEIIVLPELDVRYKTLIIGAVFLIDFMYYKNVF